MSDYPFVVNVKLSELEFRFAIRAVNEAIDKNNDVINNLRKLLDNAYVGLVERSKVASNLVEAGERNNQLFHVVQTLCCAELTAIHAAREKEKCSS